MWNSSYSNALNHPVSYHEQLLSIKSYTGLDMYMAYGTSLTLLWHISVEVICHFVTCHCDCYVDS